MDRHGAAFCLVPKKVSNACGDWQFDCVAVWQNVGNGVENWPGLHFVEFRRPRNRFKNCQRPPPSAQIERGFKEATEC